LLQEGLEKAKKRTQFVFQQRVHQTRNRLKQGRFVDNHSVPTTPLQSMIQEEKEESSKKKQRMSSKDSKDNHQLLEGSYFQYYDGVFDPTNSDLDLEHINTKQLEKQMEDASKFHQLVNEAMNAPDSQIWVQEKLISSSSTSKPQTVFINVSSTKMKSSLDYIDSGFVLFSDGNVVNCNPIPINVEEEF